MDSSGFEPSSSCLCSVSSTRREARAEQAELRASLDTGVPLADIAPRGYWTRLFALTGLLAQMEVSPKAVAAVPYRAVAVQVARAEQQVYDDLRYWVGRGTLDLIASGNDNGDRHGDPEKGYLASVWGVGDLGTLPGYRDRVAGRVAERLRAEKGWMDYQVDQARADFDGSVDEYGMANAVINKYLAEDLAQFHPQNPTPTGEDELPGWSTIDRRDRPTCHGPENIHLPELGYVDGLVFPVTDTKPYVSTRDHDTSPCPALAPSPIDYLTWSDAFRQDEAGVLGWALARHQVRYFGPSWRGLIEQSGIVTIPEVTSVLLTSRQASSELLLRLVERGFARRESKDTYRLYFEEMYVAGDLHQGSHALDLRTKHDDEIRLRDERRSWMEVKERPLLPVKGSRFGRLATDAMIERREDRAPSLEPPCSEQSTSGSGSGCGPDEHGVSGGSGHLAPVHGYRPGTWWREHEDAAY